MTVQWRSSDIALAQGGTLKLMRVAPSSGTPLAPVLLWHDAVLSGHIFQAPADIQQALQGRQATPPSMPSRQDGQYSPTGLAPWLAERGFDVAIVERRGHGQAMPRPARGIRFDQTDIIVEEIPAALAAWLHACNARRTHIIAHGWGGVLMAAHLARFPATRKQVSSQVYLGTRRQVCVTNPTRTRLVDRALIRRGALLRKVYGYLPARRLKLGTDDEYANVHRQQVRWLQEDNWQDARDGFDYRRALIRGGMPPTLHIAGNGDDALGAPGDVARFRDECGPHQGEFRLLGAPSGLRHEYDHDDMLAHPDSHRDVYPLIEDWLLEYMR